MTKREAEAFETIFDYSVKIFSNEDSVIVSFARPGKIFDTNNLNKTNNDIGMIIDNLVRLRLITDQSNYNRFDLVSLTNLGLNFMLACKFQYNTSICHTSLLDFNITVPYLHEDQVITRN